LTRRRAAKGKPGGRGGKSTSPLSAELATSLVAEFEASLPNQREAIILRYGVSDRTLRRWIARCRAPELAALVLEKRLQLREGWKDKAVSAHRKVLEALEDQAVKALKLEHFTPEATHALAGAGKLLGELLIGDRVFPDAVPPRLDRQVRASGSNPPPAGGAPGGSGAGPPGSNGHSNGSVPGVVH
jgi:hypothetical protein